jgi:predicted RNase H-like nuclease
MRAVVGLDGFRNGWVAVSIDGDQNGIRFLARLTELLELPYAGAMIDMPVGLPARGYRDCDLEARRLLGACASRVFIGARRGLWEFSSRAAAHNTYKAIGDAGVSCQLWCLRSKLKEVDEFVAHAGQGALREAHPELVFWRLNGNRPLPSKRSHDGLRMRRGLVRKAGFAEIDDWLDSGRMGHGAKGDDVLDACACAIAARDAAAGGGRCVPGGSAGRDERGIEMTIWF